MAVVIFIKRLYSKTYLLYLLVRQIIKITCPQYSEDITAGNDILTSIGLGSIKQLPDYAFYSCENLLSVKVGAEMNKMGKIPFRGCTKLTGIENEDGAAFFSDNAIIYQF